MVGKGARSGTTRGGLPPSWHWSMLALFGMTAFVLSMVAVLFTMPVIEIGSDVAGRRQVAGVVTEIRTGTYTTARGLRSGYQPYAAYEVGGRRYLTPVRAIEDGLGYYTLNAQLQTSYRIGEPVDVYYRPDVPQDAIAGRAGYFSQAMIAQLFLVLLLVLLAAGSTGAVVFVERARRRARRQTAVGVT